MSDFDPVVLFFIVRESLAGWFWPLLAIAAVLAVALMAATLRARRRHLVGRSLLRALAVGAAVTVVAAFAVPAWTLAPLGALTGGLDVLFAVLFALVPGSVAAAVVYVLGAWRGRASV